MEQKQTEKFIKKILFSSTMAIEKKPLKEIIAKNGVTLLK